MSRYVSEIFIELRRMVAGRLTVAVVVWLAVGLAVSAFVVWGFAEITEEVAEGESRRFDRAVLLWIESNVPSWMDGPMRAVTVLGDYLLVMPLLVVVSLVFFWRGWKLSAVMLCVSTAGGMLLTTVLKNAFRRARPEVIEVADNTVNSFSYPSGHATLAVGFYGALALILAYRLSGFARWAVAVLGAFLILLIGFSRLYLGVHYPTDVLAGFLAAPLWLVSVGGVYALWLSVRGLRAAEGRRKGVR